MKRILLYFILTIGIVYNLQAQNYPVAIENVPVPVLNLRIRSSMDYSGTSNVLDNIPSAGRMIAFSYSNDWVQVYMPSPVQNVETTGYVFVGCQHGLFDYTTGYVTVQGVGSSGLNIRSGPGTGYQNPVVQMESGPNGRTVTGSALGWDGQEFACTGTNFPSTGTPAWYQIYLTSDCSQATGWVSAQYVTYTPPSSSGQMTCNNSTQNVAASSTSCTFNISSNTTYCTSIQSSTLQGLTVTPSMNNPQDPNSGIGNGTITCNFSPNTSNTAQSATIVLTEDIGTQATLTLTINQAAASQSCTYTASASGSTNYTSSGGSGTINVTAGNTCQWTASTSDSWINITSGSSGTGNETVNYNVIPNGNSNPLNGTITISGQSFTQSIPISEAASTPTSNPAISLSGNLSFGNVTVGSTSSPEIMTITNNGNAPLNVSSINYPNGFSGDWNGGPIPANGGSQNVNVTFSPTAATSYNGTVTINSNATSGTSSISCSGTGTQTNAPLSASFTLSQTSISQGGTITATSTSTGNPTTYAWTSNPSSGVSFSSPNSASTNITFANTGTYNINLQVGNGSSYSQASGQPVTVSASINSCTYSLSPVGSTNYLVSGGSGTINVTAGSNCPWSATTNVSWISLQNTSGTGNGTVSFTVQQNNTSPNPLTGNITIAGQTVTITQAGTGTQTGTTPVAGFTLSSTTINQGGTITATNTSTGNPTSYLWWTSAPPGDASFSPNGSGTSTDQSPTFTFNTAGTYTVYLMVTNATGSNSTSQQVTISAIAGCSYSLSPRSNTNAPAGEGTYNLTVNTSNGNNCSWTATSNNSWITITSGSSGTGNGTVSYHIASYSGSNPRHGSISIGGQNFAITQAGVPVPASISIDESATVIPPWQREGDAFSGQMTVDLTKAGVNPKWHIEADVFDPNGKYVTYVNIGEGTSGNTIKFSSNNIQQYDEEGYHFNWSAVLENTNKHQTAYQQTKIIEAKWDKKNVVYFNDGNHSLNIPLKYIKNCVDARLSFSRSNNPVTSSYTEVLQGLDVNGPFSFMLDFPIYTPNPASPSSYFINDFASINNNNSNLSTIAAGVFIYTINYFDSQGNILYTENGDIDLVKIGNFDNSMNTATNKNKIIVMVDGNINIEEVFNRLLNLSQFNSQNLSLIPWSIADNICFQDNDNVWYIATGNLNSLQKNAFDLGIALQDIKKQCIKAGATAPDISVITHDIAGLEMRIMMDGKGAPDGDPQGFTLNPANPFSDVTIGQSLHTVVFIGSPNNGVRSSYEDNFFAPANFVESQINDPNITSYFSTGTNVPNTVRIVNVAAFRKCHLDDGEVDLSSSDNPILFNSSSISMFYVDGNPIETTQFNLSLDDVLATSACVLGKIAAGAATTTGVGAIVGVPASIGLESMCYVHDATTIYKIYSYIKDYASNWKENFHRYYLTSSFVLDNPKYNKGCSNVLDKIMSVIDDDPVSNCTLPSKSFFCIALPTQFSKSVVRNGLVTKIRNDSTSVYIGRTDENGILPLYLNSDISIGDTLNIEAVGAQNLSFIIDSTALKSQKIKIPLLKLVKHTFKIENPTLSLINQTPITENSSVRIKVSAINAINYEFMDGNDSAFVPLTLDNANECTIKLDTGENQILIRYDGKEDSLILSKDIWYFPESLMNTLGYNVNIAGDDKFIGTKIYNDSYDDQFQTQMTANTVAIPLLKSDNILSFMHFGYKDTSIIVDSTIEINLNSLFIPISYSSATDSAIFNFIGIFNPEYWKNITVMNMDSTSPGNISLKQYDDSFANLGLQPETRTFELRNLSNTTAHLKAAMALDQADTPDSSEVYLLSIHDGVYTKYQANIPNLTEYDPEVQKIEFDSVQIAPGGTERLVLMKKLAPIMPSQALKYPSGSMQKIPLSLFAQNPDSIPHDMQVTATIISSPAGMETYLDSNYLHVISPPGDSGDIILQVTATHDFISMTKNYDIKIAPPPPMNDNMILYPNPASNNLNIVVEVANKFQLTSLTIYNVWGQVIKIVVNDHPLYQGYHVFTVPLGYLPAGIYFVEWRGVMTKKFIKYSESE